MRQGRHAANDGSFARSTGAAAGRGVLLLAVAAALGIVLYQGVDDVPPGARVAAGDRPAERPVRDGTTTTVAPEVTTTTVPLKEPKDVKVLVANGTTVKGLGGRITDRLRTAGGYNTLAPTNAPAAQASTVFYVSGFQREAAALAESLGLPPTAVKPMPTPPPLPDLRGANVLVVVGPDLAEAPATAGSTTSTTTAGRATTSTTKG